MLKGKNIILGVTGSISAYKATEIVKMLRQEGATVYPLMTKNACKFITPLTLQVASGNKVFIDMFEEPMSHIEIVQKSEVFLVAPATANVINKYSSGIADDFLTTALLAFRKPVVMAPAMNWRMYQSPQVQKSIEYLAKIGVTFVEPEKGLLACGEEGVGRLASINRIFEAVVSVLTDKDLQDENFLITAGPTREYIDPIRFITNKSSGKMGYALAKVAKRRGAKVTLISGPTKIDQPDVDRFIQVETTEEMLKEVMKNINSATTLLMSAAPLDFSPVKSFKKKIEKLSISSIPLKLCPDILKEVSRLNKRPFTVGFAAESGLNEERAMLKFKEKSLSMIVLNDIMQKDRGMNADTNEVVIIYKKGKRIFKEKTPLLPKEEIADIILSKIKEIKLGR